MIERVDREVLRAELARRQQRAEDEDRLVAALPGLGERHSGKESGARRSGLGVGFVPRRPRGLQGRISCQRGLHRRVERQRFLPDGARRRGRERHENEPSHTSHRSRDSGFRVW